MINTQPLLIIKGDEANPAETRDGNQVMTSNAVLVGELDKMARELAAVGVTGIDFSYTLKDPESGEVEVSREYKPSKHLGSNEPWDECGASIEDLMYEAIEHHFPGWDESMDGDPQGTFLLKDGLWTLQHHDGDWEPALHLCKNLDQRTKYMASAEQIKLIQNFQAAILLAIGREHPVIMYSCDGDDETSVVYSSLGVESTAAHKAMDEMVDAILGTFAPDWDKRPGSRGRISRTGDVWMLHHHSSSGESQTIALWKG